MDIELGYSSVYHPQSEGQTERVNQCMENYLCFSAKKKKYLCCMASTEPKQWTSHMAMVE